MSSGRITGIRGWNLCDEFVSLACDNRAQVLSYSPDSGSFQFPQRSAKVNGRPSFMAITNGSFGLAVFALFVESVCRNQAARLDVVVPSRRGSTGWSDYRYHRTTRGDLSGR